LCRTVKTAVKRRYDASSRQVAARKTRRKIILAARALFLDRGYARTTVPAIAEAAGVSVETIYLSVGPKAALVRHLIETALSGTDEPVPALERAGVAEIQAEPDPRHKIRMFARVVRQLQERLAPIWAIVQEAAAGDAELASLIRELNERHVGNMRLFVEHLATAGALRTGLSIDLAADVVWATNSPEFYGLLVRGRGWTGDTLERWLADAWEQLLLD
jgi:AcrR family transcriptional regulator